MQLGTRWAAGAQPPASVPSELHAQISAVEKVTAESLGAQEPTAYWTLTWLEGRPVAELDTGVIVSLERDGSVSVRHDIDDEFA